MDTHNNRVRKGLSTLSLIKADIRRQHDLYVNNLVGDVRANSRDCYRYINSQKNIPKVFPL